MAKSALERIAQRLRIRGSFGSLLRIVDGVVTAIGETRRAIARM
jgi:hypothetical protein